MKIAILTDLYSPALGGVETASNFYRESLIEAGHDVILVAPIDSKNQSRIQDDENVKRIRTPVAIGDHSLFMPSRKQRRRLASILEDFRPDVVHTMGDIMLNHYGIRLAKEMKIPVAHTPHTFLWKQQTKPVWLAPITTSVAMAVRRIVTGTHLMKTPRNAKESWVSWRWRRYVLSLSESADVVTPPSEHLGELLRSWGCTRPIVVNPNAVSGAEVQPLPSAPHILWIARVSHEKRPLEFLEAVRIARTMTKAPFTVTMVGGGPLLRRLSMPARDAGVVLHGPSSNADIARLYELASVLCVSSYGFDNQPMVIAEALMAGRGVIYRDPSLREGLETGAGYLTKDSSVSALAQAICDVVDHPEQLQQMSRAAVKSRRLFSLASLAGRLDEVYKNITQKH